MAIISYGIFKFGAEREVRILVMIRTNRVQWRHQPPIHPIPSQLVRKIGAHDIVGSPVPRRRTEGQVRRVTGWACTLHSIATRIRCMRLLEVHWMCNMATLAPDALSCHCLSAQMMDIGGRHPGLACLRASRPTASAWLNDTHLHTSCVLSTCVGRVWRSTVYRACMRATCCVRSLNRIRRMSAQHPTQYGGCDSTMVL